jgi:hypothetical protein
LDQDKCLKTACLILKLSDTIGIKTNPILFI